MNKYLLPLLILIAGCQQKVESNWNTIDELSSDSFKVTADADDKVALGDELQFSVEAEQSGRVWVIHVDSNDDVAVLYPNQYDQGNEIAPGEIKQIPAPGSEWSLGASEPVGESLVAFIVVPHGQDLSSVLRISDNTAMVQETVDLSWGIDKQFVDVTTP